jgi:predicted esterase
MLGLSGEFAVDDVLYLAPQASDNTWYPFSFLSPIDRNEPGISSGMRVISELLDKLTSDGMQPNRVVILGFSQGACLSLEFAARHAQRFGGVVALSGGLIGPPGTPRNYPGSLDATPVFLGCSDVDPHIPVERVRESADVFRRLAARVDERIYRGMGHTVNADEIDAVNAMLAGDAARGTI